MTTQPQRQPQRAELHPVQLLGAEPDAPPSTTETVRGGRRLGTQPQRLHHLLDRLLRDVLLPEEREQLAQLVRGQEADLHRYEEVLVGDLNEANIGLQRQAARAEVIVARVRQAVDAGPVGSCCAHLIRAALNPPAGLTPEEREAADAYAAKLNAPPSAATLAFIAERIADGTAPRRKVRRRAAIDSPSDTAQQREGT